MNIDQFLEKQNYTDFLILDGTIVVADTLVIVSFPADERLFPILLEKMTNNDSVSMLRRIHGADSQVIMLFNDVFDEIPDGYVLQSNTGFAIDFRGPLYSIEFTGVKLTKEEKIWVTIDKMEREIWENFSK